MKIVLFEVAHQTTKALFPRPSAPGNRPLFWSLKVPRGNRRTLDTSLPVNMCIILGVSPSSAGPLHKITVIITRVGFEPTTFAMFPSHQTNIDFVYWIQLTGIFFGFVLFCSLTHFRFCISTGIDHKEIKPNLLEIIDLRGFPGLLRSFFSCPYIGSSFDHLFTRE